MLNNENDFSDQRLRMLNCFIVRHMILRVLWKNVCINIHIKEIFTVLVTTDLRLSSI